MKSMFSWVRGAWLFIALSFPAAELSHPCQSSFCFVLGLFYTALGFASLAALQTPPVLCCFSWASASSSQLLKRPTGRLWHQNCSFLSPFEIVSLEKRMKWEGRKSIILNSLVSNQKNPNWAVFYWGGTVSSVGLFLMVYSPEKCLGQVEMGLEPDWTLRLFVPCSVLPSELTQWQQPQTGSGCPWQWCPWISSSFPNTD